MADWSLLHEFHADPLRFAHVSWLDQYPDDLLQASLGSAICRRLLTKDLLETYPYPQTQNFDVPDELVWALADADQLRDLAIDTGVLVFAPWIRKVISRPRIKAITNAIGLQRYQSALETAELSAVTGDVFVVISGIHDEATMREFFVDVGWACLLQLLTSSHAHLAWRFRLLGRNPQWRRPSGWQVRCDPDALWQRLPELTGEGVLG